jgi:hypothetical protein
VNLIFFYNILSIFQKELVKMLRTLYRRVFTFCLLLSAIVLSSYFQAQAQSQALNGQIEGVVTDAQGAAVPNASITVRNIEKGSEVQVNSDENGVYRAPLLPLGTFRITVEAPNFNRLVREGVNLSAGETATVDLSLTAGDVSATVTITSDAPIADPGKIDLGRVMNTREIQDLPLVSRNPYRIRRSARQRQRVRAPHEFPARRQRQHASQPSRITPRADFRNFYQRSSACYQRFFRRIR